MRKVLFIVYVLLCTQINAQIPKDLQGYWKFKVDKPGERNGFEIGEDYIEGKDTILCTRFDRSLDVVNDADKIIAEILTPHKGKVVYMDFWGTWCGPCVAEMEYAPAAKMAVEDKDVVFIYMANGTSKAAWENFIKAKNLEGANVFHYNLPKEQQSIIERRLGVLHFPTYMLFDKGGSLVNKQAPRPSQLDNFVKEIEKLLE